MDVKNGALRSRDMEMEVESSSPSKRRKVESHLLTSSENSVSASLAASVCSTPTSATSFSSCKTLQDRSGSSLDLNAKVKGFETDLSTFFLSAYRETTQSSELYGDSEEMESSKVIKNTTSSMPLNSKRTSTAKMPSAAEIDEFFSVAENYEQKRFAEKYNYDIVKDVALEGRYKWVPIKL